MSTENLAKASNHSRVPSTRSRNVRSGIPVAHREFPTRGGIKLFSVAFFNFFLFYGDVYTHWQIFFMLKKNHYTFLFLSLSFIPLKRTQN